MFPSANQGWLIVDLSGGPTLSPSDELVLSHPEVFGVILTQAKSYGHPDQGGTPYANTLEIKNLVHQIKSIRSDLLICIDHEGGRIVRFQEEDPTPYLSEALSKVHSPSDKTQAAKIWGHTIGQKLKDIGIDVLLGPLVDRSSKDSSLLGRTISSHPDEIIRYASFAIEGIESSDIQVVLKHFPGLGDTTGDTHKDRVIQADEKNFQLGLSIFTQLLQKHPNSWIMHSHASYPIDPDTSASLSKKIRDLANNMHVTTQLIDDISMGGAYTPNDTEDKTQTYYDHLDTAKLLGHKVICMHNQPKIMDYLGITSGDSSIATSYGPET